MAHKNNNYSVTIPFPLLCCRLQDHLGRGQFGTVNRGQWCVSEREVEVAVKSLPAGSTEDERVKFLQEAAIMGQFKHPNILRIHGVLTAEEPVRK